MYANIAYFAMNKMLSSRLLNKATKKKLYTSYLRLIVMYACERKVLRKIHGPVRNYSEEFEDERTMN